MQVLLRKFQDKYYVWKKARWEGNRYYITTDGYEIDCGQTDILAIKEDERSEYVACANCGEIIHNDPNSIEQHFVAQEAKTDCLKCSYLTTRGSEYNVSKSYEPNGDGTYKVTKVFNSSLGCTYNSYWGSSDISAKKTLDGCQYRRCRKLGVKQIEDIFIQYPGLFDKQITVDVLLAKKCKYDKYNREYFEYDLKCRDTLKACVNEMGIVDHFVLRYRYNQYTIYYSEKYNLILFEECGKYSSIVPYGISDTKYVQIKDKITELYKEAK